MVKIFIKALDEEKANELYDMFNDELNKYVHTEMGVFRANMKITALHDGPVTIIIDSK